MSLFKNVSSPARPMAWKNFSSAIVPHKRSLSSTFKAIINLSPFLGHNSRIKGNSSEDTATSLSFKPILTNTPKSRRESVTSPMAYWPLRLSGKTVVKRQS